MGGEGRGEKRREEKRDEQREKGFGGMLGELGGKERSGTIRRSARGGR